MVNSVRLLRSQGLHYVICLAVAVTACGSDPTGDKSGGEGGTEPIELEMAFAGSPTPDAVRFADEVGRRSGGLIDIEFRGDWRSGDADYEAGTIADVQHGDVAMAWVGARAFDTAGVTSFQALLAPMLIDSQDLQGAVFDAGIPGAMLAGLEDIGLVGIGVLPGPMRKILGVDDWFVAPADFRGAVVGIQESGVAELTMAALGAETRPLTYSGQLDGLDAYDQQFGSIATNQYWRSARFVTANVNLWPRPLVIFMNGESFDALSPGYQTALRDAAAAVVPDVMESVRLDDSDGAAAICGAGMTFAVASADDLAALRAAVEPVYAELAADRATADYMSAIAALKDDLDADPDGADCAGIEPVDDAVGVAPDASTAVDGIYEVTTSAAELRATGDAHPIPENWGDWVYVLDRGRFAFTQENAKACTWAFGTYEVTDDRIAFTVIDGGAVEAPNNAFNRPGEFLVFGWSLDGEELTLTPVPGEISPENFRVKPWHRTRTTPDADAFSTRCPPPPEGLDVESTSETTVETTVGNAPLPTIPDGTYTRVATQADGQRLGLDPELVDIGLGADGELPITFEIDGDRWSQFITDDAGATSIGDAGTASYDAAGRWVTVSDSPGCPSCVLTFDWTLVDGALTLALSPNEFHTYTGDERFTTEGLYQLDETN